MRSNTHVKLRGAFDALARSRKSAGRLSIRFRERLCGTDIIATGIESRNPN
jgi:hypothetical protein